MYTCNLRMRARTHTRTHTHCFSLPSLSCTRANMHARALSFSLSFSLSLSPSFSLSLSLSLSLPPPPLPPPPSLSPPHNLSICLSRFKRQTTKLATRLSCQAVFFRVLCILLALAVGIVICFTLSACGRKYFSEIGSDYDLYCPPFQVFLLFPLFLLCRYVSSCRGGFGWWAMRHDVSAFVA